MKLRQGYTEERANGVWTKIDVELEDHDLQNAAMDAGLLLEGMTTQERFKFGSALVEMLLYARMAQEDPESGIRLERLGEAKERFNSVRDTLLHGAER